MRDQTTLKVLSQIIALASRTPGAARRWAEVPGQAAAPFKHNAVAPYKEVRHRAAHVQAQALARRGPRHAPPAAWVRDRVER